MKTDEISGIPSRSRGNTGMKFRIALVLCLFAVVAHPQPPVAFEVASVKSHPPSPDGRSFRRSGGDAGMATYENESLRVLIAQAFGIVDRQIEGPDWLASEGYDIVAKFPAGVGRSQLPDMLQSLLTGRFGMTSHRETRTLPVYALVVAKSGLKINEASTDTAPRNSGTPTAPTGGGAPMSVGVGSGGGRGGGIPVRGYRQINGSMTMAKLASYLSSGQDRPVIDATDLKGSYEVKMTFVNGEPEPDSPLPGVFEALEKLGLKLEQRKAPVDFLVIDHIEKVPIEN